MGALLLEAVMVMGGFVASTLLLALSGLPGLLGHRRRGGGEGLSVLLVLAGALLGIAATVAALALPGGGSLDLPWAVPGGRFALHVDAIAACFLLPLYLVSAAGAVFGLGYWPQSEQPATGVKLRFFYGMMAGSLALVFTARNGLLFLVAWEVMALVGFFLITTESDRPEARRAGLIYLGGTHTGTLALIALFALLGRTTGTLAFPAAGTLAAAPAVAAALFLLGLFGFGLKAGLIPLHIWLPGSHSASPSHASALLSGVMIKAGIYGLVRLTGFFVTVPPWWGWLLLGVGLLSGVLGVAFAIAQHDLKRLLAYHSVENVGIIAIGLGVALLGRAYDQPLLVGLGLAGALLHVINHGLFKSLLFLGAGSVIHATGSRDIDHYGGLLGPMPLTGLFFLGGAVAISGLPPFNGFVSEWLIYLGLFHAFAGPALGLHLAVFAAPVLALIGALALACFVKVFGVAFLGQPRSSAAAGAHEAPPVMRAPMGVLLGACLLIGFFPALLLPLLGGATRAWGATAATALLLTTGAAPVARLTGFALALTALLLLLAALLRRAQRRGGVTAAPTWGCGYLRPAARMQYTASSLAQMLVGLFAWGLRPEREGGEVQGLFPSATRLATHTPDTVLDRLLLPLLGVLARGCTRVRARLQQGSSAIYLLYFALAITVLLAMSAFLRG